MNPRFETPHPPARAPARSNPAVGTILLGGIIALFGLLWLLDSTGAINSPWHAVLPGTLIITGLALVASSRDGSHPGLIVLGAVLTVVLAVSSTVNIPLSGGIGERIHEPVTTAELQPKYDLAIGQQVIDLRAIDFPSGTTAIEARVGIGELIVRVPPDIELQIDFRVGVGDADVLDITRSGVGSDGDYATPGYATAQRRLTLDLSVGVGSLKVRHAR